MVNNIRMSYVNGSIIQRDSIAVSQLYRPSVVDGGMHDLSRGSNYLRNTGTIAVDGHVVIEDSSQFLPGTKIDIHILNNVTFTQLVRSRRVYTIQQAQLSV